MQENDEIFKDLIQTVGLLYTSFTVCSGDIEKKALKMTSQLVIFRVPTPNPKSDCFTCKSTNKKILAKRDTTDQIMHAGPNACRSFSPLLSALGFFQSSIKFITQRVPSQVYV